MTDVPVVDGSVTLRLTAADADKGGLLRFMPVVGNTSMQGKPGGGFRIDLNLSSDGSFNVVQNLLYLLSNWNRGDTVTGSYNNGGQPYGNDVDLYLKTQNTGISSDNNLRQGGVVNGALDVGPVLTLGRDVAAPPHGSMLGSIDFGGHSDGGAGFITTRYATVVARVISCDDDNPAGEFMICTASPFAQNAGATPRVAIGKGFRTAGREDLGQDSISAQYMAADVFLTQECLASGAGTPGTGAVMGVDGSGNLTWQYSASGTFALVYSVQTALARPILVACAGRAPCNVPGASVGQFLEAWNDGGVVNHRCNSVRTDTTIGRIRKYLSGSWVEVQVFQ